MERLKTKRTTRRAQNTRLINEASALLQNQDSTISQITTVAERLRANNDELCKLNEEFEGHIPDGSFETEFEAVVHYEDEATATISALQCRKDLLDQISSRGASREPSCQPTEAQSIRQAGTRLPRLTITPFKGEISKWSAFWEQFDETIHKNSTLSTSEKFGYLRSYLGGEAEAAVAGLPRTETCYADVIEILNRRFGDKKRLEQDYFSRLRLISPVKSANDTSGLRKMFDQVQINIRGLQTLGVSKSSFSSMLCDILMRALPRDIVVNYHRTAHLSAATAMPGPSSQPDRSELDRLLDFLSIEVESQEKSEFKTTETKETKTTRYEDNITRRESSRPTSSVLYNRPSPHKTRCCFCNGTSHSTADCCSALPLDQKKQRLAKEMRCFRCTLNGHRARDCRRKISCATCGGRHAKSMCDPAWIKAKEDKADRKNSTTVCTTSIHRDITGSGVVLLQTFRAWAVNGTSCRYIRGVIDGGSQQTFVTEDLSRRLQLKCVGYTKMALNTFACASNQESKKRRVVELELRSQFNMDGCKIEAIEIPVICQDISTLTTDSVFVADMEKHGKLIADRLMFPAVSAQPGISILIGSDQMWGFMTGEVTRSKGCSTLVALNTKLGWTFQGRTPLLKSQKTHSSLVVCVLQITAAEQVENALRSFWELESLGITDSGDQKSETSQVMRQFEQNIRRSGTQYEVAVPWKDNIGVLKDNKQVAMTRLRKLVSRLYKTDSLILRYDEAIREYLIAGHAEVVPNETAGDEGKLFYMPHREVIRENALTTRLRVVFDASSHAAGCKSLNECLEKGDNLYQDLLGILLRFRVSRFAITSDIQKAFLQISVTEKDRDAFRFLWFQDLPSSTFEDGEVQTWRMTRVPFGATCSPFLLTATILQHLENLPTEKKEVAKVLRNSFYVDDLVTGTDTEEEAVKLYHDAKSIMQDAGMSLRKWTTNSQALRDVLLQEETNPEYTTPIFEQSTMKVLGIVWDPENDVLKFALPSLLKFLELNDGTKRFVLQAASRIFDPLGVLSPFTIRVKTLFQKLWERGITWDGALPEDLKNEWQEWCRDLPMLGTLVIPRFVFGGGQCKDTRIHIFCDASPIAYGVAAYVTKESSPPERPRLLLAKARVAPIKKQTLPRLELLGAVIASRLHKYLEKTFPYIPYEYTLWTDSLITLAWIKSDPSKWKTFVANRVTEIQRNTDPSRWRYCPGSDNPADLLTRGIAGSRLVSSDLWWSGPKWLTEHENEWPDLRSNNEDKTDLLKEERKTVHVILQTTPPGPLLDLTRYSELQRALRVTAWCLRFLKNCRNGKPASGPLSAEEITGAELYWINNVQNSTYPDEIKCLLEKENVRKQSSLAEMSPFLDKDNVVRVGGRLQMLPASDNVKHPIIMPSEHYFTALLVQNAHYKVLHGGTRDTLAQLRERFWIVGGRRLVKKVIFSCCLCKRFRITADTAPTAPLPFDRLKQGAPFDVVGIDFAGPLYVRAASGSMKSYIVLFTCAVSRAVHLELVSAMSTEAFLMAFRRFTARRGLPTTIYSDNALTFKKASKDIHALFKAMQEEDFTSHLANNRITWKFIVPSAPWWGGWWERLVRTVKTTLRKVLGRACLTFEELSTVLTEVEGIVNSRPLTVDSADATEPKPITPGDILLGKRLTCLPDPTTKSEHQSKRTELIKRIKYRRYLMDNFWKRWQHEYLLQLRSAHHVQQATASSLSVNDVVLVHDSNAPRQLWQMGRVLKTHKGRDGKIRSCQVKLQSGLITDRPVQRLYPLEVST